MRARTYVALILAAFGPGIHMPAAGGDGQHEARHVQTSSPIAAQFETRLTDRAGRPLRETDWYFWRDGNRIETVTSRGEAAKIWDRDERGEITLRRVFRLDRRVVEYLPRELKALQIEPSWAVLSAVIDPEGLAALKRAGTIRLPQGMATIHKGVLNGQRVEVWWLEHKALPARVVRQAAEGRLTLALKTVHARPPSEWPMPSDSELSEYLHVDIADFGDMAYDPFVRKVERMDALTGAFGAATRHSHAH